ncbi:unnamed protein product, partial [Effrenium voratum]
FPSVAGAWPYLLDALRRVCHGHGWRLLWQAKGAAMHCPADRGGGVPACMEGRCFVLRGEVQPLQELTIWWQRPVSLLALPDAHWTRLAEADATLVPQPVLWNG